MTNHVLEPAAQEIADATSKPPFLYELGVDAARKVLVDIQAAPIGKLPPVDEKWITVPAGCGRFGELLGVPADVRSRPDRRRRQSPLARTLPPLPSPSGSWQSVQSAELQVQGRLRVTTLYTGAPLLYVSDTP